MRQAIDGATNFPAADSIMSTLEIAHAKTLARLDVARKTKLRLRRAKKKFTMDACLPKLFPKFKRKTPNTFPRLDAVRQADVCIVCVFEFCFSICGVFAFSVCLYMCVCIFVSEFICVCILRVCVSGCVCVCICILDCVTTLCCVRVCMSVFTLYFV